MVLEVVCVMNPLGVLYTMDHEVVTRPYRICDRLLNLSQVHIGLHQGKNVRVTMDFEVPYRHNLRPTLSTNMVQLVLRWDRKMRCFGRESQGP